MKNLSLTRLALAALFLLSSLNISSAVPDFQVDGISYKITSIQERECCVFGRVSSEECISRLVVPSTVRFNGASFTVVGVYGDVENVQLSNSHFENIIELILPITVKWIGEFAFSSSNGGARRLERIKMDGVEIIRSYAFKDCHSLETISTALNKLQYLGDGCFMDTRVSLVIIPPSCKEVGIGAFSDCRNRNYSIIIQDSDEPLMCRGGMGFHKDYPGQKIYIGRNIWSKEWYDSYLGERRHEIYQGDIYNFREIEYGDKVTEILSINPKRYYSGDLENLPFKITIGASIKEVPDFSNDGILIKSLYLVSAVPPFGGGAFSNRTYLHGTLFVPKGYLETYKNTPGWKNFLNIQEYETSRTIEANKEYFAQLKKKNAEEAEAERRAKEAKQKAEEEAKRKAEARAEAERYAKEVEARLKAKQEQERDLNHIDSNPNETQVKHVIAQDEGFIYQWDSVDGLTMPDFPGGSRALFSYIHENIQYPTSAKEKGIKGRVICAFVVNKDGTISDVEVVRSGGDPSLDEEAVRVIRSMPPWIPGRIQGKAVRVRYSTNVSFVLP